MPQYAYVAMDSKGKEQKGKITILLWRYAHIGIPTTPFIVIFSCKHPIV